MLAYLKNHPVNYVIHCRRIDFCFWGGPTLIINPLHFENITLEKAKKFQTLIVRNEKAPRCCLSNAPVAHFSEIENIFTSFGAFFVITVSQNDFLDGLKVISHVTELSRLGRSSHRCVKVDHCPRLELSILFRPLLHESSLHGFSFEKLIKKTPAHLLLQNL